MKIMNRNIPIYVNEIKSNNVNMKSINVLKLI
jgi:hypothetical protein